MPGALAGCLFDLEELSQQEWCASFLEVLMPSSLSLVLAPFAGASRSHGVDTFTRKQGNGGVWLNSLSLDPL